MAHSLTNRDFVCSICRGKAEIHPITFVKHNKIWTVDILMCKNEDCLEYRGATWVDYQTEQRAKRPSNITVEPPPPVKKEKKFTDILNVNFLRIGEK
jgi:hypothetical protein